MDPHVHARGCGSHAHAPLVVPDADRRAFLKGLAGLPLAAVLADPALAQVAAGGVEMVSIPVAAGGEPLSAALALPKADKGPALVLTTNGGVSTTRSRLLPPSSPPRATS